MNIVGFGDSFIMDVTASRNSDYLYMSLVGKHFGVKTESRGIPGTGPWYMFFDFLNYNKHIDVAIIAWSEIIRMYHNKIQPLSVFSEEQIPTNINKHEREIYNAAINYNRHILNHNQKNWELRALMCMFDEYIVKQYPNTKFIHLPCFSWYEQDENWNTMYDNIDTTKIKYYYDFKHGVEIRPCLMYVSKQDEWPSDLSKDHRPNHLTLKYHNLLAKSIIEGIENYNTRNIVNLI